MASNGTRNVRNGRDRPWPAVFSDLEELRWLLRQGLDPNLMNPDSPDSDGFLHTAALAGDVPAVRLLLKSGADAGLAGMRWGRTPLHWAAQFGREKVAGLLLAAGADPNACDEDGKTPLHLAALQGWTDVYELLFRAGADVQAVDHVGCTAMHFAARFAEHPSAISALCARGGDPNAENMFGTTPLHCAIQSRGRLEVVRALLDSGANPRRRTCQGDAPLDLADRNLMHDVVALLKERMGVAGLVRPTGYSQESLPRRPN